MLHVVFVYVLGFMAYFAFVLLSLGRALWGYKKLALLCVNMLLAIGVTLYALKLTGMMDAHLGKMTLWMLLERAFIALLVIAPVLVVGAYQVGAYPYIKEQVRLWKKS